jgi:exopolysaccharide production protein ExoZ
VYFYLILAFLILFKIKRLIVATIAITFGLATIGLSIPNQNLSLINFLTNPILFEFTLGCVIGLIYQSKIKLTRKFAFLICLTGFSLLAFTAIYGYGEISESDLLFNGINAIKRATIWGIPSTLIVLGFIFLEASSKMFSNPICLLLGDSSYSLYLYHWISIFFMEKIWEFLGWKLPNLFIALAIVSSILLGFLVYVLIEKKLTDFLNQTYSRYLSKPICFRRSS